MNLLERTMAFLVGDAYVSLLRKSLPYLHSSMLYKCAVTTGEDGKPIIPTSAEQLRGMLNEK
jgi:hypothetical protein